MEKTIKKYTKEFREKSAKEALKYPTIREAAKELNVPFTTLGSWVNQHKQLSDPVVNNKEIVNVDVSLLKLEKEKLEQQLKIAHEEMAILKKAFVILARTS